MSTNRGSWSRVNRLSISGITRTAVLALCTALLVTSLVPAAANAAGESPGLPTTPAVNSPPPWNTGTVFDDGKGQRVPAKEAEEFARFWTAMFLGAVDNPELRAWFHSNGITLGVDTGGPTHASGPRPLQLYLDSDKTIDDLFREFTAAEQRYLVVHLINYWHKHVPGFTQSMQLADSQTKLKLMRHIDLAAMVAAIVFDKHDLKRQLGAPYGGDDQKTTVPAGAPVPGAVTATDEAKALFDGARAALLAPDSVAAAVVPPELTHLVDQAERLVPPVTVDPAAEAEQITNAAEAAVDSPPGPDEVQALLDKLRYQACAQLPGAAQVCAEKSLGEPALFHLDADVVHDAKVLLVLDPAVSPGGLGGRLEATRLTSVAAAATVTVRMYVEEAQGQLMAGFVGLPANLQTVAVGLDNPVAARDGDVRLRTMISHNAALTPITLTLLGGFAKLDSPQGTPDENRTMAKLTFERAPAMFMARARMLKNETQSRVEVAVDAPLATPKVTATVTRGGASRSTVNAVIDSLPEYVDVAVDLATPEGIVVDYKAPKPTKTLTVTSTSTSSAGTETLAASFTDVPAVIHAIVGRERLAYNASSVLTRATVSRESKAPSGALRERMAGTVEGVPTSWSVETLRNAPFAVRYNADLPVGRITASYHDAERDRSFRATVDGLPSGATTLGLDMPSGVLSYSAQAEIPSISATARVEGFDAGLLLRGVPRSWNAAFGDHGLRFAADGDGIGSVSATVTNHVTVVRPAENHASLNIAERTVWGKVVRDVDASFLMTDIKSVSVQHGEPAVINIEAGGGKPFRAVAGMVRADGVQGRVDALLSSLPTRVHASIGRTTAITTSANFDLTAIARYGQSSAALADVGVVPLVHGIAVRDGRATPGGVPTTAYEAKLWLTGLPTAVTFGSGSFSMRGFKPKQTTLTADLDLDDAQPEPVRGRAVLTGLPLTGLDLDVRMASNPVSTGGEELKVLLDSFGKSLGHFTAEIRRGGTGGKVVVSNIPSKIEGTFTEVEGKTVVDWKSKPITRIATEFHHVGTSRVRGSLTLTDIPGDFALTVGRDASGSGPVASYHASHGGLDIEAFADGTRKTANSALNANLEFRLVNLPKDVELISESGKHELVTSGKITEIFAKVSASYRYAKQGKDELNDGGWLSFPYEYRLNVGAAVEDFSLRLTNVSSFSFDPGILSKVGGNFGSFDFGWDALPVSIDAYGSLKAKIDWPAPFGSSTVLLARASVNWSDDNVDLQFHRYVNQPQGWIGAKASVLWFCEVSVDVSSRPGRDGSALGTEGVHFGNPALVGGHYYLAPNPGGLLPDALVDLAAFALADNRKFGLNFGFSC